MRNQILSYICLITVLTISNSISQPYQMTIASITQENQTRIAIYHHKGEITVNGYTGNVILVRVGNPDQTEDKNRLLAEKLQINDRGNTIELNTQMIDIPLDLQFFVPVMVSLSVQKSESGTVHVRKLDGLIEIENPYGDVRLTDISGSAVINSTDGNLWIQFAKVMPNTPMSFATFEGNIELGLPEGTKNTLNIKTALGIIDNQLSNHQGNSSSNTNYSESRFSLNGGGSEIYLQTYSGNIILKKNNKDTN